MLESETPETRKILILDQSFSYIYSTSFQKILCKFIFTASLCTDHMRWIEWWKRATENMKRQTTRTSNQKIHDSSDLHKPWTIQYYELIS